MESVGAGAGSAASSAKANVEHLGSKVAEANSSAEKSAHATQARRAPGKGLSGVHQVSMPREGSRQMHEPAEPQGFRARPLARGGQP